MTLIDLKGAARPLWTLIAIAGALSIGTSLTTGLGFAPSQLLGLGLFVGAMLTLSAAYRRRDERIARLARAAVELFLFSFFCGAISYAAASLDRPLWDATLLSWDRAIGFDWHYWLGVLDRRPVVHAVLLVAYLSLLPQWCLAIALLSAARAWRSLDIFLLAFGLSGLFTVAIATYMPALSPLVHLGIVPADHPNIMLAVSNEFAEHTLALRDGTMRMVDLKDATGLVTFPSFHTVGAILLMAAYWPLPRWRWPGLTLNAVMLAAIPIEGSHYIVDVIAGAGVALVCLAVAARVASEAEEQVTRVSQAPATVPR